MVAIDDRVILERVRAVRPHLGLDGRPRRGAALAAQADGAYARVGLLQHPGKRRRDQTTMTV
eukprot:821064-Lingulodinium_polyedra.AAC.1